jgi:hypothetical protein
MEKTSSADNVSHVERSTAKNDLMKEPVTDEVVGYETNLDELPKGYYTSKFFLGSMLATALGLWAGTCAFVSDLTPESDPHKHSSQKLT